MAHFLIFYFTGQKIIWLSIFSIMFLITVTWTGPILAPVLLSFIILGIALSVLLLDKRYKTFRVTNQVSSKWIAGAFLVYLSFIYDYTALIIQHYHFRKIWNLTGEYLFDISQIMSLKNLSGFFSEQEKC